eukprot:Skav229355  [mRNA]  locus=scaffold3209:21972:27400:- [translate_table: standard]
MRVKILQACEIKLGGCKKRVRFGAVERFDPILSTRPSGKCVWSGIRQSEKQLNKAAVSAAFKTWRFCATGVDGEEDAALVQDSFEAWRSKPPESGMFEQIFQDLLEGIGLEDLTAVSMEGEPWCARLKRALTSEKSFNQSGWADRCENALRSALEDFLEAQGQLKFLEKTLELIAQDCNLMLW